MHHRYVRSPELLHWALHAGLFLLASLPFLNPVHIRPIPSFYGEWSAAIIGLVLISLALLLRSKSGRIVLPRILVLPAVFLCALGFQFLAGRIYFSQQGVIYALYLLLAACMMTAGRILADELGERALATSLAAGFVVGGLLQVIPSVLQLQGIALEGWTIPVVPGYSMYGNIAQRNHLAHLVWLGIASLTWLCWSGRVRIGVGLAALAIFMLIAPYTGSRSVFLYPSGFLLLTAVIWPKISALSGARRILKFCILLLPATLLFNLLSAYLPAPVVEIGPSSAESLLYSMRESGSISIRRAFWRVGLAATATAPWLGSGPGSVPLTSLEYATAGLYDGPIQICEHYHNVVVNWLAEFGIPVTLVALVILAWWLVSVWRGTWTAERWWLLAMLSVTGIHSMLEYPLWYTYFLAPTALLLGAFSPHGPVFRLTRLTRPALLVAGIMAVFMLNTLRHDFLGLARVYIVPKGAEARQIWRSYVNDLIRLRQASMFSPYATSMLVIAFEMNPVEIETKRELCEDSLHLSPAPAVLFRCAAIAVLAGAPERGTHLMRRGLFAFPGEASGVLRALEKWTVEFPELAGLLNLAAEKTGSLPSVAPPGSSEVEY